MVAVATQQIRRKKLTKTKEKDKKGVRYLRLVGWLVGFKVLWLWVSCGLFLVGHCDTHTHTLRSTSTWDFPCVETMTWPALSATSRTDSISSDRPPRTFGNASCSRYWLKSPVAATPLLSAIGKKLNTHITPSRTTVNGWEHRGSKSSSTSRHLSSPTAASTSLKPWAAPARSTVPGADLRVAKSQGSTSLSWSMPMPCTSCPSAFAAVERTSGIGSNTPSYINVCTCKGQGHNGKGQREFKKKRGKRGKKRERGEREGICRWRRRHQTPFLWRDGIRARRYSGEW